MVSEKLLEPLEAFLRVCKKHRLAYMLMAGRPLDIFDAKETITEQRGKLDEAYLKSWAKTLGLAQKLSLGRKTLG